VGDQLRCEISKLLSRVGNDHHCLSFLYSCVLLLAVFFALCMLVVGGVAYIYTCGFLVDLLSL